MTTNFFDSYQDEGGLSYVSSEEKAILINNKVPFKVLRVWHSEGQFGPKYTLVVDFEGEERALSFGSGKVESRDRMLDAMMEYLDQEGDPVPPVVYIAKIKQSQVLKNASDLA
jgi:hypothetical protein